MSETKTKAGSPPVKSPMPDTIVLMMNDWPIAAYTNAELAERHVRELEEGEQKRQAAAGPTGARVIYYSTRLVPTNPEEAPHNPR